MPIKISDAIEGTPPTFFDLQKELMTKAARKTLLAPAIASMAVDSRYNAEFDTFYKRANALRDVSKKHSWTRATVSNIARATVGAGFRFVSHPVYGRNDKVPQAEMDKILMPVYDFFYGTKDTTRYLQDIIPLSSKIYYTVVSLIYYGQAAWEIIYDSDTGMPVGFDVLPGIVRPNVNEYGRFLRPAYFFRPWNSQQIVSYRNPEDLMYITWPGTDFNIYGSSEYESVADITIPSDLYASSAYRNHFENVGAPYNGFWVVSKDTSPEDYRQFLMTLVNRYSGVVNFGRTPIVIKGDAEFRETRSRSNDDAPYLQGRQYNQEEISAVSAVPSAKLGLAANTTKTNYREMRRDFHENTLRPIFEILEQAIYQQIMVRGFNMKGWMLAFKSPDLNTTLEQATILTRYIQNGVYNINEARSELGMPPREDDAGNAYYQPSNSMQSGMDAGDPLRQVTENRPPEGGSLRSTNTVRVPYESEPRLDADMAYDLEKALSEDQLKPSKGMIEEAKMGLKWRREFGRGGTPVGIARARDISNNKTLSESTWKRVYSFFARHEVDKQAEGFNPGEKGYPSNGRIAWALWGGDPGFARAKKIVGMIENKESSFNSDDEISLEEIIDELKTWKNFATRVAEGKRQNREFVPMYIPLSTAKNIQSSLDTMGNNSEIVKEFFDKIIESIVE